MASKYACLQQTRPQVAYQFSFGSLRHHERLKLGFFVSQIVIHGCINMLKGVPNSISECTYKEGVEQSKHDLELTCFRLHITRHVVVL